MKSYAQAGQDKWVVDTLAALPTRIIPGAAAFMGYFVDVGAHDGVTHSNTYALETDYGWTGLCVEPNPEAYEALCTNRRCVTVRCLAGAEAEMLPFDGVQVGSGPGLVAYPLWYLLEEADAPPVIDYLSVDTEGYDLHVLRGMDWGRWHVRLITVEHNLYCDGPARKDAIHEHLTLRGFERAVEDVVAPGYGPFEDFYVNQDFKAT